MSKILLCVTVLISMVVMGPLSVYSDEEHMIESALQDFFTMLQSGNVTDSLSVVGGDLFEETKELLQNNADYGEFLRNYYAGAEFQVGNITHVSDGAVAEVSIIFSNGDRDEFELSLAKALGRWKVVKQTHFPTNS